MATDKQERAVEYMVENGGIASRAMIDAGYSKATAKTPQKLTESKGFKEICEQHGLTDGLIISSLVEDIKAKPQNRKPELELGAKIRQMLVDKTDVTSNGETIVINISKEGAEKYGISTPSPSSDIIGQA